MGNDSGGNLSFNSGFSSLLNYFNNGGNVNGITSQNGFATFWTGGAQTGYFKNGEGHGSFDMNMHVINITENNNSLYSPWQVEFQKGINWIGEHFVAEGTAALKHGSYFSILLKNGIGATFGAYTENRYTLSYNDSPKVNETNKFDISGSYGVGAGYSYDDEDKSSQISFGVLTFGVEITKSNIFMGWNPNINLGIGIGGELGFKTGLNFQTNGWFNYNNW